MITQRYLTLTKQTMSREKKPDTLNDVLTAFFKERGLLKDLKEQMIIAEWEEVVGEEIGKRAKAERVDDGVLFVKVSSDAWRTQLLMVTNDLLAKIKDFYNGEGIIKSIRFIR